MPLLDLYERKARLTPGLLAVAPIPITIATLGLKRFPAVAISGAVVVAAGGTYLLAVLVANFGRRAQDRMQARWGGMPTTALLRASLIASNETQSKIWRKAIAALTDVRLHSHEEEAAAPQDADDAIQAAVGQILYLGHGKSDYPLVAAENAQYGLERNLFGFRWVGRFIALICVTGLLAALVFSNQVSRSAVLVGVTIDVLILLGWLIIPSEKRTKAAGYRYARQLLNAVTREAKPKGTPDAGKSSTGGNP